MLSLVVLDTCVIFPMPLCDTLLRAAEAEFYRLYFSQEILDEVTRNLVEKGKMTEAKAARYQAHIKNAFPEAIVEVPQQLIERMTNHPKDRHVVAAAVKTKADIIVTFNLKDFPKEALEPFGIEAQHPDDFLLDLCEFFSVSSLAQVIREQAASLKRLPNTIRDVLNRLSRQVPKFAGKILCHEYGDFIVEIAQKTLKTVGTVLADGERVYEGKQYRLWQKNRTLTITDKNSRGEILSSKCGRIEGNFLLEDLEKFEEFNHKLDYELEQSRQSFS
ncbi:MAG: PIN domain-containing protein [Hydrococcus sp. C42_A2020_068]|nr:PIN domain-containing protein [Hydrococcus sp. C42_A2020_068]